MMAMEPIGDQLNIETPELVSIELPLAGIGSRFIAILVDSLILGAAVILLIFLAAFIFRLWATLVRSRQVGAIGIFLLIIFLLFWGYFALFEAFNNGRTPGKRVAKIRVIHQSGRGVNFAEALARNLVRIIDYLPGFYGVGIAAMFMSRQSQRLGDMVAGTLVVREREVEAPMWGESTSRTLTAAALAPNSPIPPPHLRVLLPAPALAKGLPLPIWKCWKGFFSRRFDMDLATRSMLANRIASALCAKSGLAIPPEISVETFLEAVAHQVPRTGADELRFRIARIEDQVLDRDLFF
jgi:uncharacterized RDD family membrane protein YckC